MSSKVIELSEAISDIWDGASIALGGLTLHRAPIAAVHEIVRQGKRDLEIIKAATAYDVDLLAGAGCISTARVAFVGYESEFGMANLFRKAVQEGRLTVREQTCYSVIASLRAAIQGVPFMPMAGVYGSDLIEKQPSTFRFVHDPFTGQEVVAVPAVRPDFAIIHVQEADEEGNAVIYGTEYEDVLMAKAAQRVIITTEKIIDGAVLAQRPELTKIPGFVVSAVVLAPNGAHPTSCGTLYPYDSAYIRDFIAASRTEEGLQDWLETRINMGTVLVTG